jgi:hypothetical protein
MITSKFNCENIIATTTLQSKAKALPNFSYDTALFQQSNVRNRFFERRFFYLNFDVKRYKT